MAYIEQTPSAAPSMWSKTSLTAHSGSELQLNQYYPTKKLDSSAALSTQNAPASPHASPSLPVQQPNGGALAWMQVVAAFSVFFNTWGMLNTFGVFQTYYESGALFRGESSSTISWIGCVQAFAVLSTGLFSGPIYDRGHLRYLLVVGSFLIVFGFMMLSISKTYWQVLLAQGFSVGIGAGLLFVPTLAVLPAYFSTRLGLAVGVSAAGSSVGGVIYPIMFYHLLSSVGFGWATRIMAFTALATLMIPIIFLRMRVKPAKPRDILDWSAFTDWPYAVFTIGAAIGFTGLYTLLVFISYFSSAAGVADAAMSFYLIPILNAGSTLGRTVPNYLSDKFGPMNLFGPAALACAVLTFSIIAIKTLAGIIVLAILYGFFSGVYVALPPVCFVRLTKNKSKIGTRIGMGMATCGLGVLASGPGGGNIIGTNPEDLHWNRLWIFSGSCMVASSLILYAVRFWLAKGKLFVKI
ncbi:hypothetical protein N0V90_002035 [Kalmusia sp. IMI 367209]|nr:hypothetical protein N0V90_002035 [Kalmusia sp. IMI 367209]